MSIPSGQVFQGDCLEVLRTWPDGCVDAIVTDPPYGLNFMGKDWDKSVPGPAFFEQMLRVLVDGGRLLCFAGSRTSHRMGVNIEDAGFTLEDQIMWLYGSGFPKHESKFKPAHEPIWVARKGRVTPLQIDAGRIGEGSGGRWPANIVFDAESAAQLDDQCGMLSSGGYPPEGGQRSHVATYGEPGIRGGQLFTSSEGGASRFFYCAKADGVERNAGLDDHEAMPFAHSGGANNAIDRGEDYDAAQGIGLNQVHLRRNTHPTVKPVDLMRWLVRLVASPGELVLDPFAGSGTTLCAAAVEGVRWVGIELDPKYAVLAKARAEYWRTHAPVAAGKGAPKNQGSLLDLFGDSVTTTGGGRRKPPDPARYTKWKAEH